jgi:hypothetical protein
VQEAKLNTSIELDGHRFKNFTGIQKKQNLMMHAEKLTSVQKSSKRFYSFFDRFENAYYLYTFSFPCLYFLLSRYSIEKPFRKIYGLIDKMGDEDSTFKDHKHFIILLNFGSLIFPVIACVVTMFLLFLILCICGRKRSSLSKAVGLGIVSH